MEDHYNTLAVEKIPSNKEGDKSLYQKGILFIMNPIGGGTEQYQNTLIEKIKKEFSVYKMKFQHNSLFVENLNGKNLLTIRRREMNQKNFQNLLKKLHIEVIYINHFIQFPLLNILNLIQNSGIKYHYFIHDYYCVCPRINLLNNKGVYCRAETNASICQNCINKLQDISIETWRQRFLSFLMQADKVIAPSNSTKNIVNKYYPDLKIDVLEHSISTDIYPTFNKQFVRNPILSIAFMGTIHKNKGSDIVYKIVDSIERNSLPIRVVIIGTTDNHQKFTSPNGKFIVTGKYEINKVSSLLANYEVSIVVMSSICPETFSYTTSEAMLSGYPVIAFGIGAPAERILQNGGGWILKEINSESIIKLLLSLLANRDEIIQKANELKKLN
jgi:glycosyltransferase involved in cell wall biosynthesis